MAYSLIFSYCFSLAFLFISIVEFVLVCFVIYEAPMLLVPAMSPDFCVNVSFIPLTLTVVFLGLALEVELGAMGGPPIKRVFLCP